jgi:hypothetical protein
MIPTKTEEYLFDLKGYTVIKSAVDPDHIREMNEWIDALPPLERDRWLGRIDVHSFRGLDGMNLQNFFEASEIFERLIDHPAWIEKVRHYLGPMQKPFIHEGFINIRGKGGYIGVHSGGHGTIGQSTGGRDRRQWCCGYLTVLAALNRVGTGDGATVVVPCSHKSDFPHPMQSASAGISDGPGENVEGAIEVHLEAGDALLINDYVCHGSAERTNPGQRRMIVFRYLPHTSAHRWGYTPSDELLARLSPARREIVQPIEPRRPKEPPLPLGASSNSSTRPQGQA